MRGDMVFQQGRAAGGGHSGHIHQVFECQRHAMQPTARIALGELCVTSVGLLKQQVRILQIDNRIGLRVDGGDALPKRLHDLAAGKFTPMYSGGQLQCAELVNSHSAGHLNEFVYIEAEFEM